MLLLPSVPITVRATENDGDGLEVLIVRSDWVSSNQGADYLREVARKHPLDPNCDNSVNKLLGGSPEQFSERYQQTSPIGL